MAGQRRLPRGKREISQLLCRRRDEGDSVYDRYRLRYARTRTRVHLYIYTLIPWFVHAGGMHPHACARIGARLSRDVSHGGFA